MGIFDRRKSAGSSGKPAQPPQAPTPGKSTLTNPPASAHAAPTPSAEHAPAPGKAVLPTQAPGSLFDRYSAGATYADNRADWSNEDTGVGADEHAKVQDAGVTHVAQRGIDPRMVSGDVHVFDQHRIGILHPPRHHLLPEEEIEYFQERGFPGRDIDRYTVEMGAAHHDEIHGINQPMARQHWKKHEWNTELMRRLHAKERALWRKQGPKAKISRQTILKVMKQMRVDFNIDNLPIVHY